MMPVAVCVQANNLQLSKEPLRDPVFLNNVLIINQPETVGREEEALPGVSGSSHCVLVAAWLLLLCCAFSPLSFHLLFSSRSLPQLCSKNGNFFL